MDVMMISFVMLGCVNGQVELWIQQRHMPRHLRRQITSYYSEIWVRQEEWKEAELFVELPIGLRAEVADWLVCDILRQSDIFGCAALVLLA